MDRHGNPITPRTTWADMVGVQYPDWNTWNEKNKRRIRNAAWGRGFQVDPQTGIVGVK